MNIQDKHTCELEGARAFQQHGVTGIARHSYPLGSVQRSAFVDGHDSARMSAWERSLSESSAYQALSVRDNTVDRAWAAKLAQA